MVIKPFILCFTFIHVIFVRISYFRAIIEQIMYINILDYSYKNHCNRKHYLNICRSVYQEKSFELKSELNALDFSLADQTS